MQMMVCFDGIIQCTSAAPAFLPAIMSCPNLVLVWLLAGWRETSRPNSRVQKVLSVESP